MRLWARDTAKSCGAVIASIHRYLADEDELRFYYIGSARRLGHPEDLLRHQAF